MTDQPITQDTIKGLRWKLRQYRDDSKVPVPKHIVAKLCDAATAQLHRTEQPNIVELMSLEEIDDFCSQMQRDWEADMEVVEDFQRLCQTARASYRIPELEEGLAIANKQVVLAIKHRVKAEAEIERLRAERDELRFKTQRLEHHLHRAGDDIIEDSKRITALEKALHAMLLHSCVADSAPEDKFAEDHDAERLARTALAETVGDMCQERQEQAEPPDLQSEPKEPG